MTKFKINMTKFNIANEKIESLGFMIVCSFGNCAIFDESLPITAHRFVCSIDARKLSVTDNYNILDKLPLLKAYILHKNRTCVLPARPYYFTRNKYSLAINENFFDGFSVGFSALVKGRLLHALSRKKLISKTYLLLNGGAK